MPPEKPVYTLEKGAFYTENFGGYGTYTVTLIRNAGHEIDLQSDIPTADAADAIARAAEQAYVLGRSDMRDEMREFLA